MMNTLVKHIRKRAVLLSFLIFSFGILISCGSSGSSFDDKAYTELKKLVNSRNFEIENEWANPIGGGRINLIGNPNHINFKGDSVDVYLPYFGVRHSGGGYSDNEGGFKYKGPVKNLEISENSTKGNIEVSFEVDDVGEDLDFNLIICPNKKARTNVISSQRSTIAYDGEISKIQVTD